MIDYSKKWEDFRKESIINHTAEKYKNRSDMDYYDISDSYDRGLRDGFTYEYCHAKKLVEFIGQIKCTCEPDRHSYINEEKNRINISLKKIKKCDRCSCIDNYFARFRDNFGILNTEAGLKE